MHEHTCQLTRLDKFSTIRRYSVRNGGPYLDDDLEFLLYLKKIQFKLEFHITRKKKRKKHTCLDNDLHHLHVDHRIDHDDHDVHPLRYLSPVQQQL